MKTPYSLILILCLFILSCKNEPKVIKTESIDFTKEGTLQLFKSSSKATITTLDIEFAETEYETQTGIMYRSQMKQNQAMLFIFKDEQPRSFYMKNTQIPLDIIYLNKDKKVVSIQKNAQPLNESSLPSNFPAQFVLEVNAGLSDQWNLAANDSISFTKR